MPMTTLLWGHDMIGQRKPRGCLRPFASMAAQAMEQNDGQSSAPIVSTGKPNALACLIVPLGSGAQRACSNSLPTSVLRRVGFSHPRGIGIGFAIVGVSLASTF